MSRERWRRTVIVVSSIVGVVGVGGVGTALWLELAHGQGAPIQGLAEAVPWDEAVTAPSIAPAPTPEAATSLLQKHSTSDPASPWVVVNKQHPIDKAYEPADLVTVDGARVRAVAEADLRAMVEAARADGVRLQVRSGYRSYPEQAAARSSIEARRGFAHAERYSARPGFSEHQTGLAVDVDSGSNPGCNLQTCFSRTAEGVWVAEHGWEYGFVVRYTEENTAVTGYAPEGWHLRWVGRELTKYLHDRGITSLEEALDVSGGPEYVTN